MPIEEYKTLEKSGWEVPIGAVITEEKQEIKEDALGNKIYENGSPVYATKYYYTIERYHFAFYIESSGKDKIPYWGSAELEAFQREGDEKNRIETYYIETKNMLGKDAVYSIDQSSWDSLSIGDKIRIKPNDDGTATILG